MEQGNLEVPPPPPPFAIEQEEQGVGIAVEGGGGGVGGDRGLNDLSVSCSTAGSSTKPTASATATTTTTSTSSSSAPTGFKKRSKNNVTAACENCKRRRRKCNLNVGLETGTTSSLQKCEYCLLKGLDCVVVKGVKRGPKAASFSAKLPQSTKDLATTTIPLLNGPLPITIPDSNFLLMDDISLKQLTNSAVGSASSISANSLHINNNNNNINSANTSSSSALLVNDPIMYSHSNPTSTSTNTIPTTTTTTRQDHNNQDDAFKQQQQQHLIETPFSSAAASLGFAPYLYPPPVDTATASLLMDFSIFGTDSTDQIGYSRNQDPSSWTCLTFFCMQMLMEDGRVVGFVDFYFHHVHLTLPFFEQSWLECHLGDLPLNLLHIMYAFCLTCQTPWQVSLNAERHYRFVFKNIHQDLESADPFTVATLIHMCHFAKFMRQGTACINHLSLAINLAIQLQIYDPDVSWQSPLRKPLHLPSMTLGMWFTLYALDFTGTQLYDFPLMIEHYVTQSMIDAYTPPNNSSYPCGGIENNLTMIRYQLPLITLARDFMIQLQYGMQLNFSKQYQHLLIFDSWFQSLPTSLMYTLDVHEWKGRGVTWMNGLYYTIRLRLLRDKFVSMVTEIQEGSMGYDPTTMIFIQCTHSVANLTNMASIFATSNLRGWQCESSFLQNCIYYAGLFNCALLVCHGKEHISGRDAGVCLDAMRRGYGGRDVGMLQECVEKGYAGACKALELIRNDQCWVTPPSFVEKI